MNKINLIIIFISFSFNINLQSQDQVKLIGVGFYNLENLFDTENDTLINDEEFLPNGANSWTQEKYEEKQSNMAYAISQIGIEYTPNGLSVIGVSEIENRKVLEDLVKQPQLKKRGYKIVHENSQDWRGIDVALLYNPNHFTPIYHRLIPLLVYEDGKREYTRDIMMVTGTIEEDTFTFLVNHWPSRRGGEEVSAYKRNKGAALCREVVDSLYKVNPNHKVVVMGDLNDDPTSPSIKAFLKAKGKISDVNPGDVFNPMEDYYRRGIGSNAYRDTWSLFDQILLSSALVDKDDSGYNFYKAFVFNKKFLIQTSGQYKSYPFRTFSGNAYQGGYSDHFPTYVLLTKKILD